MTNTWRQASKTEERRQKQTLHPFTDIVAGVSGVRSHVGCSAARGIIRFFRQHSNSCGCYFSNCLRCAIVVPRLRRQGWWGPWRQIREWKRVSVGGRATRRRRGKSYLLLLTCQLRMPTCSLRFHVKVCQLRQCSPPVLLVGAYSSFWDLADRAYGGRADASH